MCPVYFVNYVRLVQKGPLTPTFSCKREKEKEKEKKESGEIRNLAIRNS